MGSFLSQVFQTPFGGGPWIAVAECRQATLDRRIWIICTAGSKCSAGCWWWEFLWPLDPLMTSSDTFPEYSLTGKGPQLLFILNIQVPQTVTNTCIDRDGGRVFPFFSSYLGIIPTFWAAYLLNVHNIHSVFTHPWCHLIDTLFVSQEELKVGFLALWKNTMRYKILA